MPYSTSIFPPRYTYVNESLYGSLHILPFLRYCGRWILSYFHYLFNKAYVIAWVVCGETTPHIFMLLKSLYLRYSSYDWLLLAKYFNIFFQSSSEKHTIPEQFTLAVLEMLPSVNCVKPQHTLSLMTPNSCVSNDQIIMDQDEFGSATFQRVYQYLRRHTAGTNLDRFSYTKRSIEGTPYDCLKIILRLIYP